MLTGGEISEVLRLIHDKTITWELVVDSIDHALNKRDEKIAGSFQEFKKIFPGELTEERFAGMSIGERIEFVWNLFHAYPCKWLSFF